MKSIYKYTFSKTLDGTAGFGVRYELERTTDKLKAIYSGGMSSNLFMGENEETISVF